MSVARARGQSHRRSGAALRQGHESSERNADNQHAQGSGKLADLGLDSRRISEWRDMRDAGEDAATD